MEVRGSHGLQGKGLQFAFIGVKRETLDKSSGRSRRRFFSRKGKTNCYALWKVSSALALRMRQCYGNKAVSRSWRLGVYSTVLENANGNFDCGLFAMTRGGQT